MRHNIYVYIFVMAAVTYAIRALPLVVWTKEIKSPWIRSFLYYVPYAALAAMTFPAIFFSTASIVSGVIGFAAALYLAYRGKSLLTVAISACAVVFVVERIMAFL